MKLLNHLLGLSSAPRPNHDGFEPLESRQLLAADLSVALGPVTNPFKGNTDRVQAQVIVTNVGDETFKAPRNAVVELYLSADSTFDASTDVLFASLKLSSLSRGASKKLKLDVPEPKLLNPASGPSLPAGNYNVIARISGLDSNPANDIAVGSGSVAVDYNFGLRDRAKVSLALPLADGTTITLRINDRGTGTVTSDNGHIIVTLLSGGTRSELVISSNAKGRTTSTIDGLIISDVVKRVIADKITVNGSVVINGGLASISLGGLTNGSISYAATNFGFFSFQRNTFSVGEVRDSIISTDVPLAELHITRWIDTNGGGDRLVAPSIGAITSLGDFQPSVTISSRTPKDPYSIITANIKGRISGSWDLAFGVRRFQAGPITNDFKATFGGNIDTFNVNGNFEGLVAAPNINHLFVTGDLRGASILVGTTLGNDVLLGGTGNAADSFTAGRLGDFTARGSVINSLIASGLNPVDNIYLNGNDTLANNSSIGRIQIYKNLVNSHFAAASLPSTVRILYNSRVSTANNPSFLTSQAGG